MSVAHLMLKTPCAGEYHGNAVFVAGINHFLIADRSAGLYYHFDSRIFDSVNTIPKWEKRIRCQDTAFYIFATFCNAMWTASTRLTCPAPSPTVVLSFAIKMPFDFA
jgi:hypothetical protein